MGASLVEYGHRRFNFSGVKMNWLKKSYIDPTQAVISVLDRNANGSIESIRQQLEAVAPNFCEILSTICDGQVVPPFYMTTWNFLCGTPENANLENVE